MKTCLTTLAIPAALLLPLSLPAQVTFERTYGGTEDDGGQSVVQTVDGGYYVVGYTFSTGSGGADVFVIATDQSGEERWTQTFGGAQDDYGYGVAMTARGDCLAAGYLMMLGHADVALHGNTADGGQLWIQVIGGSSDDMAYSVARNSDGGFIVAGATYSFGAGVPNAYVIRTDSLGDTLWTRTYGGAGEDYAFSARQTADSGYVICGTTLSFGAGAADIWLIRTDANGDTLWTRTFGGDTADLGHSVAQTADHGFILCGQTASFGAGNYDAWLIKTDSTGETLWTRTFGGGSDDVGYSVQPTTDGGYIIAGATKSLGAGGADFYLVKTDANGRVAVTESKGDPPRASAISLTCEPNPSSGTTRISFRPQASSSKPLALRIYDSQGRLVHSSFGIRASSFPLDLRDLPSGTYVCRLITAFGQTATQPVVIAR